MKKSFTLFELIIVIIILGIIGTISVEILQKLAKNYILQKEMNKLVQKTDFALNIIASKLKTRIKNSVIVSEYNETTGEPTGDFISISMLTPDLTSKYKVLEWLNYSIYSKRGMWNDSLKHIQPGWSGFVDLNETNVSDGDEYNISTPDSNFTMVQLIDGNWTQEWGINGYNNVFDNRLDVLLFSGPDGRGDISDINNSYGWYGSKATKLFAIGKMDDKDLNLSAIDKSDSTTVYEGYYVINSAMAIVPLKNGDEYNLTLRFNYYPWQDQNYTEGNSSILVTHVTKFKFKEENGLMRIYICITSENQKLSDYNLTLCKEKVVF
jgi:Tfp pilus assembly major pilin PilA